MEYISREAAITAIGKPKVTPGGVIFDALKKACQEEVRNLPAADVVAVVRCCECIRKNICWVVSGDDNWYCADGERDDGGTDYGKTS